MKTTRQLESRRFVFPPKFLSISVRAIIDLLLGQHVSEFFCEASVPVQNLIGFISNNVVPTSAVESPSILQIRLPSRKAKKRRFAVSSKELLCAQDSRTETYLSEIVWEINQPNDVLCRPVGRGTPVRAFCSQEGILTPRPQ
jgi:hypothetical protein